ncbi:MAG: class I SAM-dependent rRNA methyltransferase [Deltaproteobacteria bacterium]|nr:class I SAM-dependent rRNA methyltransferase [Deltaproteobacteria bacterium]MCB9787330.1 class I SAM-dependent rRNA methyltransferase [Deltaproteobacteria bacterium]
MSEPGIVVRLRRGRSKPFWLGHPWVFTGAVEKVTGEVGDFGGACVVEDERGQVLGSGYYNPKAQIAVRLLEHRRSSERPFEPRPFLDVVRERLGQAIDRRRVLGLPSADTTIYRVVNAEGDGLSGLVIDAIGEVAVVHANSRAAYEAREAIAGIVAERLGVADVVVAIGETASRLESVPVGTEVLRGSLSGPVRALERGLVLEVDPLGGQKTGTYADQRENRAAFAGFCQGEEVADLYAYTGGFGLHAARAGASKVISVDSSGPACDTARANAAHNGLADRIEVVQADVMNWLKEARAEGRTWGRIVCDPPKFAQGRSHVGDAIAKYARLNTLAMAALAPGGLLLTCSCSQHVSEPEFLRMLTDAGHRLRRTVHVHAVWGQAPDHPFSVVAPEGRYLKAALVSLTDD